MNANTDSKVSYDRRKFRKWQRESLPPHDHKTKCQKLGSVRLTAKPVCRTGHQKQPPVASNASIYCKAEKCLAYSSE